MVRLQEQAEKMTREALAAFFRTLQHVPEDRLDWSPMGSARTIRDQVSECVHMADVFASFITAEIIPTEFDREAAMARRASIAERYRSLSDLAALAQARYSELSEVILQCPDSRLDQPIRLPFGRGRTITGADLLFLAYWNLTYHLGQVNYLQTMWDDREMH